MNYDLIKKYKPSTNHDKYILEEARNFSFLEYKIIDKFKTMDLKESLLFINTILKDIDISYYNLFSKMIDEEDCSKPVIYLLTSQNNVEENESNTYKNEIFFYKTNTEADIYILLHEFSHFLTNRNNSYLHDPNNKKYNEIIPILIEFIISNYVGNDNYIKLRENEVIYNSKSIMIKNEISNNNYDIEELIKKYSLSSYDKDKLINDIIYNKSLNNDEEIRYIYGFLYAKYYSKNNSINNYKYLVEKYTIDRNIELPRLDKESSKVLKK